MFLSKAFEMWRFITTVLIIYSVPTFVHCQDLVSPFKEATHSSTRSYGGDASRAVDGVTDGDFGHNSCTHTVAGRDNPWWYVNLGSPLLISKMVIYNRVDCCGEKLIGAVIRVGNNNVSPFPGNTQCGSTITTDMVGSNPIEITCNPAIVGKYVSVYRPGSEVLSLCEVKVYKVPDVENPTITCPHDITVSIGVVQPYNPVTWSDPNVVDNVDTGLIATCTPPSSSSFGVGPTIVTCSATDATGNEDNCSFLVYIEVNVCDGIICDEGGVCLNNGKEHICYYSDDNNIINNSDDDESTTSTSVPGYIIAILVVIVAINTITAIFFAYGRYNQRKKDIKGSDSINMTVKEDGTEFDHVIVNRPKMETTDVHYQNRVKTADPHRLTNMEIKAQPVGDSSDEVPHTYMSVDAAYTDLRK